MPEPVTFMSLPMRLATRREVLAAVEQATAENPVRIATPNPEHALEGQANPAFRRAYASMTHCIVDGAGLYWALRVWKKLSRASWPLERYCGSDLVQELLEKGGKRFFLLGGPPGLAAAARAELGRRFPQSPVVGASDGGRLERERVELDEGLLAEIAATRPDVLLVGFGAPKQELWIAQAAERLAVPVMLGVGGTLGFYGQKRRAPLWLRRLHLEWLYRTLREPGHWRRSWRAVVVFPLRALAWMAYASLGREGGD